MCVVNTQKYYQVLKMRVLNKGTEQIIQYRTNNDFSSHRDIHFFFTIAKVNKPLDQMKKQFLQL